MEKNIAEALTLKGSTRRPIRLTVLKKLSCQELYGVIPDDVNLACGYEPVCTRFEEGQTIIVDSSGFMPPDFRCQWAWQDLYPIILTLQLGGDFFWLKRGIQYACCTDGLRPVFFKLERLDS